MYGGICGELADKNGNRKNPNLWVKTPEQFANQYQSDSNVK